MSSVYTPKQKELLKLWQTDKLKRINLLSGSVRSGKTWISLVLWAFWVATMPKDKNYLMTAKSLTSLKRNILELLTELIGDKNFSYSLTQKEGLLFGRKIYLEGASDARAESKIRGMTLQGAYCDELTLYGEDFFTMLLSRLSEPNAKLIATTNPDNPNHWLNLKYIERKDELDMLLIKFLIDDNTFLDSRYIEELKKEYTGVFYDRFIRGLWVAAEGLVYQQFADNEKDYLVNITSDYLTDVNFVSIGIDFGGTRSLTTFVASAIHKNFSKVTVLADYHIKGTKGDIDADRVCREFAGFIERLRTTYPNVYIKYVFADSEAQYLINSLRRHLNGLEIGDSAKNPIIQRIIAGNTLLNTGRMLISKDCELVRNGLKQAMWDKNKKDTRLDNFSTDIDILDAYEYSWERFMPRLCPNVKGR